MGFTAIYKCDNCYAEFDLEPSPLKCPSCKAEYCEDCTTIDQESGACDSCKRATVKKENGSGDGSGGGK